jgi:hypothetical protein
MGQSILSNGYIWQVTAFDSADESAGPTQPDGPGATFDDGGIQYANLGRFDTPEATFATQTGRAGFGSYHAVVAASGAHYMFFADEENGLYRYTESTDSWAAVGDITGAVAADIRFVTVFKSRLWMVEKDSQKAWYLPAGAISGAANAFPFTAAGSFRHGGNLLGLWNWTYDGGNGLDDSLVAITAGGDVIVYQGTDPASTTTFEIKGVWFCGGVPAGRNVASIYGGDLLIVSQRGLLPLSKLVLSKSEADPEIYATANIGNLWSRLMDETRGLDCWGTYQDPGNNALIVTVPTTSGAATEQLALSLLSGGWFRYRDLPIYSACVWDGVQYFGTVDGRVCKRTGHLDNVRLYDGSWDAIDCSFMPAWGNGDNARWKRGQTVAVDFLSEAPDVLMNAQARYQFDETEATAPTGLTSSGSGTWGSAVWDSSTWSGAQTAVRKKLPLWGEGRFVSVAVRFSAVCRTTVVGLDLAYEEGGER